MKLSWGICALFYSAAALALLVPALKEQSWRQADLQTLQKSCIKLGSSLLLAGVFSLLAMCLQLDVANAWPFLLGGAGLYGLLTGLNLSSEACGIILLMAGFTLFSGFSDISAVQLPLLASFLGLALGKLFNPNVSWEDFCLPSSWLAGLYWLTLNVSGGDLPPQVSLLVIFISVGLIARSLQTLPILARFPAWVQPLYVGLTGGLAAWLAVQNMLLQPAFLPWVGLFVGGLVLGFLLFNPNNALGSDETSEPVTSKGQLPLLKPATLQSGMITLILLGMAVLVASRLFGTTGWVVLVIGLMANRQAGSAISIAALFLLGRVLLQTFLAQYSANVTGINITHPYASGALYVGFTIMLLLPGWLNSLHGNASAAAHQDESLSMPGSTTIESGSKPITFALLGLGSLMTAGLSNYFLHGEATASLLLALLVSGLGISLLAGFRNNQARTLPLFVTLLTLTGVLASPEVLDWGNEADKTQKLTVLGVTLGLLLLTGFLAKQLGSGRKSVQVS